MRRREFLGVLGGAAAAWPLAARAQQAAMPVVGLLGAGGFEADAFRVAAFREGLKETGYVEGRNVAIEYRNADGHYDRLPALAAELVRSQVTVIVGIGVTASALAAKAATSTIPIVFMIGGDPVKFGLVASLNRPGGNATGVSALNNLIVPKQLEALNEAIPKAETIGLLMNPTNPNTESDTREALAAGTAWAQIDRCTCQRRKRVGVGIRHARYSQSRCFAHPSRSNASKPDRSAHVTGGAA
jgi:putative ABC transport system substrate-binding protein